MTFLLESGLRGYWENPAFAIGVPLLVLGTLAVLVTAFRPHLSWAGQSDLRGLLLSPRASWLAAGAAGAALLVAGVVFHPAYALGGGFILLASSVRLITD